MKIMHLCLASHYTEGMTYQDNQLAQQNAIDGHEVIVVSDCYKYEEGRLVKVEEEDRVISNGIRLVRMNYDFFLNSMLSSKIRKISRLYDFICEIRPDVILFHGVAGWEMLSSAKYKKEYPSIKLYIDSHEDFHNSGTFFLSRFFQYRLFNRFIVNRVRPYVDKFLYLSYESRDFLVRMYDLKKDEMEFYPLGGITITSEIKKAHKKQVFSKHGFNEKNLMVVHSGKLVAEKRTDELLNAFYKVQDSRLRLIIIGTIPEDREEYLLSLIKRDERILFLGWKSSEILIKYLSAADLYFQPGTQSATMQNAICCGTPIVLYPYSSHKPYLKNNGYFAKNENDYKKIFESIVGYPEQLAEMSRNSHALAYSMLDYRKLAQRLYR